MTKPNWFIGFPLSDDWVADALRDLPDGVRTFHGEDIHITIAFLGDVDAEAAEHAFTSLVETPDGAPRDLGPGFDITLGRVLPFGPPDHPSSLSVVPTVDDGPATAFIARHRDDILRAAGRGPDRYDVRPHATIARLPRRDRDDVRAAALAWAEAQPSLERVVRVEAVALYTWTEGERETLYRIVRGVRLG